MIGFSTHQALNSVSGNKEGTCGIALYLNCFRQYRRWVAFLFLVVLPSAVGGDVELLLLRSRSLHTIPATGALIEIL